MDSHGDRRSYYEERGAEKPMDEYLKSIGLHRKKIAKDGSCLFRAVAEQVLHCQSLHTQVRAQCVEFLRRNRENYEAFIEGDFEDYLYKLQDPQQWVGEVEINALAMMYKRDFWIFQEPGKAAVNITAKDFRDRVQLCFLNGNHYDCVYPLSRVKNSAICQSILYELLYERVCGVERGGLTGLCHRTPKLSDVLLDDCLPACPSSDDSDAEDAGHRQENGTCAAVVKSKGRGRGRFLSERVRRSLNPTLLRNVQFDQWIKTKKAQQKRDFCIAAGMQYSVGDRCQVRVDACAEVVDATVKKLSPNNGPVTVYNDDMGEIEVPLWKLLPPSEASWNTVGREKRVTNGHSEWEDRGRGRGRGKSSSLFSSVPQATVLPTGRISKQHSWPPQATVDDRGAPSRKSESVSFGLTKEQRQAREQEERNAALEELQFPDDKSFPALGAQSGGQGEGAKKKGGEKKRSQKNTRRSSVEEEVRAASPSCPRDSSASPPPPSSSSPTPLPPPASKPAPPGSLSYASAASPSVSGTAAPSSFSFVTPVLPAASSPSPSPVLSAPPSFIAPIAPPPAKSLDARAAPSPPVAAVAHNAPAATEARTASAAGHLSSAVAPRTEVPELHTSAFDLLLQNPKVQDQDQDHSSVPQTQPPPPAQPTPPQTQTEPPQHFPQPPPPSQVPFPSPSLHTPSPSLPHDDTPTPPPASHPQTDHPDPASQPSADHQPPPPHAQPPAQLHYPPLAPHPFPLHQQLSLFTHDPLYPGFPLGDKGQVLPTPPLSSSQSGDDLPPDMTVLRFFFNLGVKAYSYPMHAPVIYLLPLQQAHSLQPRAPSRSPSPLYHHPPPGTAALPPQDAYPPFNPTQPGPHPTQLQEASFYNQPNQQAPPNSFNPAHSAPPTAHTATQAPPTAFSPAPTHPEAPPSSYNRPTPHILPATFAPGQQPPPLNAYGPAQPEPSHHHHHHAAADAPYPPYPPQQQQPVQWQSPAYPLSYPYGGQGYYRHHPAHPTEGQQQQPSPDGDATAARLPAGALEGSASAGAANVNGGQMQMPPGVAGYGHSTQEVGENMVLLVDPPLDKPIVINVPKSGSGPGSPSPYSPAHSHHSSDSSHLAPFFMSQHKPPGHGGPSSSFHSANPNAPAFVPAGQGAAAFLQVPELLSIAVGTEEEWEEPEEARAPYRGHRRGAGGYRGRGRGQYSRGRGYGNSNSQYYNYRGRGGR